MLAWRSSTSNGFEAFITKSSRTTTCCSAWAISHLSAMPKLTQIQLVRVCYVPKVLEPHLHYVSEEFGAAVHLCACGCGSCRSHYWIEGGRILCFGTWSPEQIEAGRRAEDARRQEYYEERARQREGLFWRLWRW